MQARRRHAARAATGWGPRPLGRGFAADARAWLRTRTATRQPTQQRKRRVRKPQLESSAGATPRARQARLQRTATNASLFRPAPLLLLLIHKCHGTHSEIKCHAARYLPLPLPLPLYHSTVYCAGSTTLYHSLLAERFARVAQSAGGAGALHLYVSTCCLALSMLMC